MTRPLKHITSAMGILINTMENMERISGNSIDTAALDEARNHIAQAAAAFDQVEDEINLGYWNWKVRKATKLDSNRND